MRCFPGTAELKIPSRDRVSISSGARKPRSCVDFAEIVCRFRQVIDRGSLDVGSDLGNLRRGGELLEREELWLRKLTRIVKGSSRKSATRDDGRNSRKQAATAEQVQRSTGPVDRTCTACTGSESGRSPGRPKSLTVSTQLSVGHPVDRPVDRWKGSVDRPVDRQAGAGCVSVLETCWYKYGFCLGFYVC